MGTAFVIVIALLLVASIAFLVFGLRAGGPKATDTVAEPRRWTAQATLAKMRKQGAALPSEVGKDAKRSEDPR